MCSGILIDSNDDRINLVDEIRKMFTIINEVSNSNNLKNEEINNYSCSIYVNQVRYRSVENVTNNVDFLTMDLLMETQ